MIWFDKLLTKSRAFNLSAGKQITQFFTALENVLLEVRDFISDIFLDIWPASTRQLDLWETQFGLPADEELTEEERRVRLDAAWKRNGGQSPHYLQETMQAAGFNVWIHEWWEPGIEPPEARNPNLFLQTTLIPPQCFEPLAQCGEPTAQCTPDGFAPGEFSYIVEAGEPDAEAGEPDAEAGNFNPVNAGEGYLLVNKLYRTTFADPVSFGDADASFGEPGAEFGVTGGFLYQRVVYEVPPDVNTWPYFLYWCGEVFGTPAFIPASRRDEFENLLLSICPAQQWLALLIEYFEPVPPPPALDLTNSVAMTYGGLGDTELGFFEPDTLAHRYSVPTPGAGVFRGSSVNRQGTMFAIARNGGIEPDSFYVLTLPEGERVTEPAGWAAIFDGQFSAAEFSPTQDYLFFGTDTQDVWRLSYSGNVFSVDGGNAGGVASIYDLTINPDGDRMIISGGGDTRIVHPVTFLSYHFFGVPSFTADYSPDGAILAIARSNSASSDFIFDATTFLPIAGHPSYANPAIIYSVRFAPQALAVSLGMVYLLAVGRDEETPAPPFFHLLGFDGVAWIKLPPVDPSQFSSPPLKGMAFTEFTGGEIIVGNYTPDNIRALDVFGNVVATVDAGYAVGDPPNSITYIPS